MAVSLNTDNREYITWQFEQLNFGLLGGLKIEGLERMRVTLKVEYKQQAVRHNLDLYNNESLDKLVRRCAERFTLGTAYLAAAFAGLINELEAYRLEQLKALAKEKEPVKQLSESERKAAEQFLQQPELLQRTNELIGQSGVIGEENNRLLMYLVFTSRKREEPLHVISLGSSGTGKTHLQEKVGELMPVEDVIQITSLSENAFYYFGKQELKHKLILIEDLDGAGEVLYPLRELQSKKMITKTVVYKNQAGDAQTVHLRVEGPICVVGCTTKESVYEDNSNRSFLLHLDESKEQDEKIMHFQRLKSAGKINSKEQQQVKQLLQNVQRTLQPVKVRNLYAEYLQLPASVFKPRRTNAHYLAFIEAVTFYHQYQREQKTDQSTGEVYIETTVEDIREANRLLSEILLRKSDELSGACRNYFEQAKTLLQQLEQTTFTNKEIRKHLRLPGTTVRRYNHELLQNGYIKLQEQNKQQGYLYEIVSFDEYQQLQKGVNEVLNEILTNLQASEPPMSQITSGSTKPRSGKKKNSVSQ
jgi:predicted transcriptional regulator